MINLTKKQLAIIIVIGVIIISVIGYYIYSINDSESYEQIETISEEPQQQKEEFVENDTEEIVIHIAGEVNKPGIVKIKEGARIADVIEKAEGLTDQANLTNINLAYIVEDGQKITIPSKEEDTKEYILEGSGQGVSSNNTQTNTSQNNSAGQNTKININKATKEELQTLSGIGESTAQKIIDYRKENGDFKQIEDIKNVSGIGEAKYNAIKDNIKIK